MSLFARGDDDANMSNGSSAEKSCDLFKPYSFLLQSILGLLAFSTLILKRYREPAQGRRPFWIWMADTTKQALGMLEIHFVNLIFSNLISHQRACFSYLLNFLLDSIIGLPLIFLLLKAVSVLVNKFDLPALRSGEYGEPFKLHYWLAQCAVYLVVMLIEKLIVGPLVAFQFWEKGEGFLPSNPKVKIAIVIFIVPFTINVIMFWILDSILMRKTVKLPTSVSYHRSNCTTRYGRLESEDRDDAYSSLSGSEDDGETAEHIELQLTDLAQLPLPHTYSQLDAHVHKHGLSDSDR